MGRPILTMKAAFLLLIACAVAVNCLPADPDDVVPESVLSSEVVGAVTSKKSKKSACFPPKLMNKLMRDRGSEQDFLCDGIQYYITVPKRCSTKKKCGLIMDIHGWSMDAAWEEAADHITKWSKEYITIRPQEGIDKDWSTTLGQRVPQWDDLHRLEDFLRSSVQTVRTDSRQHEGACGWVLSRRLPHLQPPVPRIGHHLLYCSYRRAFLG